MAETTTAAPPATQSGLTKDDVLSLLKPITDAQAELTKNVGVIASTLAQQTSTTAKQGEKKEGETANANASGLTLQQVESLLDKRDQRQQQNAQRDTFVAQRLGKLPKSYQLRLGNDPAKWESEATALQKEFEDDFKATGGKPEDKGGATTTDGGQPVSQQPVDKSKLDPVDRIAAGLK